MTKQPDFDFGGIEQEPATPPSVGIGPADLNAGSASSWREVPAALYLSWSPQRQHAYCAARDEDAALHADTTIEAEWYLARARAYREMTWH